MYDGAGKLAGGLPQPQQTQHRQTDRLDHQPRSQRTRRGKTRTQRDGMPFGGQQRGCRKSTDPGAHAGDVEALAPDLPQDRIARKPCLQGCGRFPITTPMFSIGRIIRIIRPTV